MNIEAQLRLQAYLDGELAPAETEQTAKWLEQDAEARALLDEIKSVRSVLQGCEAELHLPESREFYWSKIERSIRQISTPKTTSVARGWPTWLFRWSVSFASLALALGGYLWIKGGSDSEHNYGPTLTHLQEVEAPHPEVTAISFHSQEAAMTVVWVHTGKY